MKTSQVIAVFVNNYSSEAAATTPVQKPLGKTLIHQFRSTPYIYKREFVRIRWMHQLSLDFEKTLTETALLYILGTVYSTAAPIIPAFTLFFSWRSE